MLPDCLKDWIGVRCLSTGKSGYNIDDLEGLNLRYAADIADQGSGWQLLKQKIDFATALVLAEITEFAMPYYRVNSLVDQMRIGEWKSTFIAPSNTNRGVRVKINRSRMLRIRVNAINIYLQEANHAHTVTITDGVYSESFSFTTDGNGMATVEPQYISKSNMIYVTMNNQGIHTNNTEVKQGCGCNQKSTAYITANGWTGTNVSNTTYGLVVDVVAECVQDELGCIIASKMTFPILYRSGLEIAKVAATTDRLNSITLLDEDKTDYLIKNYQQEYNKHMKLAVETMPDLMKRIDDCCIVCNQSRYVAGKP